MQKYALQDTISNTLLGCHVRGIMDFIKSVGSVLKVRGPEIVSLESVEISFDLESVICVWVNNI